MYNPGHFAEDRIEVLHSFIREHPLATIVTCGAQGPEAAHVPVVLHEDEGSRGVLRFHLARANGQWKAMNPAAQVLAIFQGPEHYITPSWYKSKEEHGKVVPTWNYVTVHVRGAARIFGDRDELVRHLRQLTDQNERGFGQPWSIDDAPREYLEGLTLAIVGIEIEIDVIEGKWKVSQNRPESDKAGVIAGLKSLHSAKSIEMAKLIGEGGK